MGEVIKVFRQAGEVCEGWTPEFAKLVHDNVPICQARSFDDFYQTHKRHLEGVERFEYYHLTDGVIDGAMAIAHDDDPDVGNVLFPLLAFSLNPKALIAGYRWLFQLAKAGNCWGCITTKLINGFEYRKTYHPVKQKAACPGGGSMALQGCASLPKTP